MVSILHTSDFHNKLTPSQAGRIRELKDSVPDGLLLDAGDAIWAGNIFFRPRGEPILKLMNQAGYNAMALGNREFHFLASGLRRKIGWAQFPVLSANIGANPILRQAQDGREAGLPLASHVIFERGGLKIAVFGLTVPMITRRMLSSRVSSYVFDDPIETAARIVPILRQQAHIVVALTHIGIAADREIASAAPGIDLIIGGHSHILMDGPERIGGTAIVHAGSFARHIGRVEIEPGGQITWELLAL